MSSTIFIGDVHGCHKELDDLLEQLQPAADDRLIFIGDLINKGPNSLAVWKRYRQLGAEAIIGNHELRLLDDLARGKQSRTSRKMREDFGKHFDALLDDIATWPAFIETDDWLAVHAGVLPGLAPAATRVEQLCTIRTWDGEGRDLQNPDNPPWFEAYEEPKLVIFGHWAALHGVFDQPNVIGLDTGCVYGGKLTAWLFEARRVVQVKARKAYCPVSS